MNKKFISTEQHQIKSSDPAYQLLDQLCFAAKNLYNAANYEVRKRWIHHLKLVESGKKNSYKHLCKNELDQLMQQHETYSEFPARVAQYVLIMLDRNWKGYFAAIKDFGKYPRKYKARPKMPGYLDKVDGRFPCTYSYQAVSVKGFTKYDACDRQGEEFYYLMVSGIGGYLVTTKVPFKAIKEVRIVPHPARKLFTVEIVHEKEIKQPKLNHKHHASIDIGLNVLAAITSDKPGIQPVLVNGRPLKSMNQFYNKEKARLQSQLEPGHHWSNGLARLTRKRTNKINDYLHKTSTQIVDWVVSKKIGVLVIGKNVGWKDKLCLGKVNNQNFTQIPHARFIELLTYKAKRLGIEVLLQEESYTSKTSFLDLEAVRKHKKYCGKRTKRGLFTSRKYGNIHADVNGSYNTMRKAIPDAFGKGIEGVLVHPKWLCAA
jgi:putative transposase